MSRELIIELLRAPGVSSDAYALMFQGGLKDHEDIIALIHVNDSTNGRYILNDDDADELS